MSICSVIQKNGRILLSLVLGSLLLGGCFNDQNEEFASSQEPERGTLRLAHSLGWGGNESADPGSGTPYEDVSMLVYNRLLKLDASANLVPVLAQSWSANADASDWTFILQDDVRFHDGKLLTAADVKFTFERIIDPAQGSPLAPIFSMLESVEVVDDQTALFHLAQTSVDFPLLLTDRRMSILSSTAEIGVGTGPFQIEIFDPKNTTRLVAFDDYWEGKPKLAAIESIAIPESNGRIAALEAGELHFLGGMAPDESLAFVGRDDFAVQSIPTGDWRGIVFRTDISPFDDARVRKALRLVVDRQAMIDFITNGDAGAVIACDSPVWTGDQYYDSATCEQDIEQAKALLAEAGYADGLEITLTTSDLDAYWRPMAEIYQFQAASAGIRVNIVEAPSDGYWNDVWMVEPAVTTAWLERSAGQVLAEAFLSTATYNETFWSNAQFDALLEQAGSTLDEDERVKIYGEVQQLLREEGGALIPFHLKRGRVMSSRLSGVDPVNRFAIAWHEVYLDEE